MIETPFIAHSELTNEIYIVVGKEKYRVTEQAIKAVMAIKALEQESTTKDDFGVGECVSKQAVLNKILKFSVTDGRSVSVTGLWTEVNALPSVTPKKPRKGHWIGHREHCENLGVMPSGLGAYEWCSECDCGIDVREWHRNHYNFCPNCGSDNREVEE